MIRRNHIKSIRYLLALLVATILLAPTGTAQTVVDFPDANLEAAVRTAIAKPTGDILDTDLQGTGFITLIATSKGISDLTGLEYATDLQDIYLIVNSISDVSPLASLTSLDYLDLTANTLTDISSLSTLTNLTGFRVNSNTNLSDISVVSNFTSLDNFQANSTAVSDISALNALPNLDEVGVSNSEVSDITGLAGNAALTTGDTVILSGAPLDSDSICTDIPLLLGRGVTVTVDLVCGSDYDSDGLNDEDEVGNGADPYDSDTDNDGFLDGDEVDFGSDPNDPHSIPVVDNSRFERMWPTLPHPWYIVHTEGITVDSRGNIYYITTSATFGFFVQKMSPNGQLLTKWGTNGSGPGEFSGATDLAVDDDDNIYLVDFDTIEKFDSNGNFIASFASGGSGEGELDRPNGIAIDTLGNIWIADTDNHRIQKFSPTGNFLLAFGSAGSGPGQFDYVADVAVDSDGYVYTVDYSNERVQKFDEDGNFITEWGGDSTYFGEPGEFTGPLSIAVDSNDIIHVSEGYPRIQQFDQDGNYLGQIGDGCGGIIGCPSGVNYFALDKDDNVYTMERTYNRIQKFASDGTFITYWGSGGQDDGKFLEATDVVVDSTGNVYVADRLNSRIQKFDADGQFIKHWGSDCCGGDGQITRPWGIGIDSNDNIYVADTDKSQIQKFDSDGNFIMRFGSSGTGPGEFINPFDVAVSDSGFIYVIDYNNTRIQMFDSLGNYVLEWGSSGTGDGQFLNPMGIAVRSNGDVYVSDYALNRIQVFNLTGTFQFKWGSFGYYGGGKFWRATGLDFDTNGDLYVADYGTQIVQKFQPDGTFLTQFGSAGGQTKEFGLARGVAVNASGDIYVSEVANNRVQKFKQVVLSENPKAIVVAGGGPYAGNDLWDATQASVNFAYRALLFQGFTEDSIYYISADTDLDLNGDDVPEVDADATNANLDFALRTWAGQQLNGLPTGDVVVYLCDHGGVNTFRMSGTETLNSALLDTWLDELESEISGDLTVVYDACESGTFQNALAKSGRTVITSASPGESAYFLSTGTISFSNFFWTQIFNGEQVSDAYTFATSAVGQAFSAQNPQVNVDGDATTDESSGDLDALVGQYIGSGTDLFQGRPVVTSVSAPQSITGTSTATLNANGVTDPEGDSIVRVWAVIRPPDFVITDTENPIQDLPSVNLNRVVATDNYTVDYDGFTSVGLYQVTIYAMDSGLNVSSPSSTTVAVDSPLERKAIIIVGGEQSDPSWSAWENVAGQAYDALKVQGFVDQNIALRSPVTFNAGVDGSPSLANLEYLIKTWGADETYDLVLYLVGPGGVGTFEISPSETLFAADLDSWLDTLQDPSTGIPGRVTVVVDSDFSGGFVPELTPPATRQRIVMGSTGSTQTTRFLSNGDISFSTYFWNRVLNGGTVRSAFKLAQGAMRFSGYGQRATWDDNGNGIADEKEDGQVALQHRIGMGVQLAGDDPVIGSIVGDVQLTGTTSFTIYVNEVTTTGTIADVTATILPPDALVPVELALTETPANSGHYEVTYNGFTQNGIYSVSVVAIDTDDNASVPAEMFVEQLDGSSPSGDAYEDDDTSVNAQLYSPGLGGSQSHTFHDDGDWDWYQFTASTYDIITIETFNLGPSADTYLQLYPSNGTTLLATDDDSSPDDFDIYGERFLFTPANYGRTTGTFYLKVRSSPTAAVSPDYGVNATYDIRIIREIGGCEVPGQLKVTLKDSVTGELVPNAGVTITKFSTLSPDIAQDGVYVFGAVVNAQYTVSVTPPSEYNPIADQNVTPACGTLTSVTYTLTPSSAPASPNIRITPSSWHFGPSNPGASEDKVFTVENIGGGILNWSAGGLAAPFAIVDGGTDFDLANGESESITVRYSPSTSQNIQNDDALIFSGDDPMNANVSGVLAEAELVADGAALLRELLGAGFTGCADLTEATNAGLAQAYLDVLYPGGTECWTLEALLEFELGENSQSILYVDFSYNGSQTKQETGLTASTPFNTLTEALAFVVTDGSGEIQIRGGTSSETFSGGHAVNPDGLVNLKRRVDGTVLVGAGAVPDAAPQHYTQTTTSNGSDNADVTSIENVKGGDITLDKYELAAQYAFNTAVFEAVFPAQVDADDQRRIEPAATIAVRVRNYSGLDLQRLWAELKPEHRPNEVSFDWIPATQDFNAKDVWILFRPMDAWYIGELLEVTAGGETLTGIEVESERYEVTVTPNAPERATQVTQPDNLAGQGVSVHMVKMPSPEGAPVIAYRIGPDAVFDTPKTVWIPRVRKSETELQYYKTTAPNDGWHDAADIVGFLSAMPTFRDDGVLLTVSHGGIVR